MPSRRQAGFDDPGCRLETRGVELRSAGVVQRTGQGQVCRGGPEEWRAGELRPAGWMRRAGVGRCRGVQHRSKGRGLGNGKRGGGMERTAHAAQPIAQSMGRMSEQAVWTKVSLMVCSQETGRQAEAGYRRLLSVTTDWAAAQLRLAAAEVIVYQSCMLSDVHPAWLSLPWQPLSSLKLLCRHPTCSRYLPRQWWPC